MKASVYDMLIIGGGPAGCRAALTGTRHGLRSLLFESAELGGTCLNRGCIPTKTLLHAARLHHQLRENAPRFGLQIADDGIDLGILRERVARVVKRLRTALEISLERANVECIMSHATYAGRSSDGLHWINAAGQRYAGRNLLIATGSNARRLSSFHGVTPEELLASLDVPSHLIIIGGGMIGLEFATIWNALGSEVHIVEKNTRLSCIPDFQAEKILRAVYSKRGIHIHCNCSIAEVFEHEIHLTDGQFLPPGLLFHACGRTPDTAFEKIQDAVLIGDVSGGSMLAHAAEYQAEQAVRQIAGVSQLPPVPIPHVLYTDPEIAWVGDFSQPGIDLTCPLASCGRFVAENPDQNGFCRIRRSNDGILQAALLAGGTASELIAMFRIDHPWTETAMLFPPHPTEGEIISQIDWMSR